MTGKIQVIMLSKEMIKKQEIIPYLYVIYRDAKSARNMCLAVVKGYSFWDAFRYGKRLK
ncbi:hypothetical protein [Aneurinibacillus danicus]|uniref:hypothetical protein n=1 Tax=Aneurinibacillus danicus TaxID=267746 RepID=UPI003FCE3007